MVAAMFAILALIFGCYFFNPWEKFIARKNKTPAPYHFLSLRNCSDEEIARFMSGEEETSSIHEAGAPDSNFPEQLWKTDPKTAAIAFAEANRSPKHRKNYQLWVDSSPSLTPPDAGWLVLDDFYNQTILRFGIDQPFLFHATTSSLGMVSNRYVDGNKHSLQIIPLSPDEARFLAHIAFWLEHIQPDLTKKDYLHLMGGSSHASYGELDWQIDKQPQHRIQSELWHTIADRWRGGCDETVQLNLSHYLFTQALPKHLGKRWEQPPRVDYDSHTQPFVERLRSQDDAATRAKLAQVILAALARHEAEPLPAKALVALFECAGDAGLAATLPALENLSAKLPPPTADEAEFTTLEPQFRFTSYDGPKDPDERKKWERYQSLETALEHDFLTQVRRPLAQAIRQLRAVDQPALLREMAQGEDELAMWALRRIYQLQPDAYSETLIHRFATDDTRLRDSIFETLASVDPVAARRLRDSLTDEEQAKLLFEITDFERTDDPPRAQSRIPKLLEIVEKPAEKVLVNGYPTSSQRGPAITLLAKLPLNPADQKRFERLLLNELISPTSTSKYSRDALTQAADALLTLPNPERFWDALYETTAVETGSSEFRSLFANLASLAIATPEPRLSQLAELLRPRFRDHKGQIDNLFRTALALDLRSLAPEIQHFATSGPTVPDGESTSSCKNNPDEPCLHRYHSARHVIALWQEPDADTQARMWAALLLNSPYDFTGSETIPSCLRDRCRSAIIAASPEIYDQLIAKARATSDLPKEIANWLAGFPYPARKS